MPAATTAPLSSRSIASSLHETTVQTCKQARMSVYLVVNSSIDDPGLLDEYVQAAGATLGIVR